MNPFDLLFGQQRSFAERSFFTSLEVGFRYFLFAGVAWILAYRLFRNRWSHRKIIPRFPESIEVRRELGYSLLTLVIFGVVGAATVSASRAGYTQMYWRISDYGRGWFFASIACAIVVHDTYFYCPIASCTTADYFRSSTGCITCP